MKINDPKTALKGIKENYNPKTILFNGHSLKSVTSHAQGYARYRAEGYDYHLFTYSNVAGKHGYLYIVSDAVNDKGTGKYQFTLPIPAQEIRRKDVIKKGTYNPHFNHPCGIQILGDYLVVPAIPYHTANSRFYDSAIVYIYDLASLKSETPSAPSRYKEVFRIPKVNGSSLSCCGAVRLSNGTYAIAVIADNNLDIYVSSSNDVWNCSWSRSKKYKLKASSGDNHYQGMGLLSDGVDNVYAICFDTRGMARDDYADLYKLTTSKNEWIADGSAINPIAEKHLIGGDGARFTYGGSLEIRDSKPIIYSIECYYTKGGLRINIFE